MKTYEVKVGFMGGEKNTKALYTKNFIVKAQLAEYAEVAVYNGLSMQEYHNFKILATRIIDYEH